MDLKDFFLIARRRWRAFLAGTLLALTGAVAGIPFLPGRFRSECQVLCAGTLPASLEDLKALGFPHEAGTANLLPLLNSTDLGVRVEAALRAGGDPRPPSGAEIAARVQAKKVEGTGYYRLSFSADAPDRAARGLAVFVEEADRFWQERIRSDAAGAAERIAAWRAEVDRALAAERKDLEALRTATGLEGPDLGFDEESRQLADALDKRGARVEELEASARRAAEELRAAEEVGLPEVTASTIDGVLGGLPAMGWFSELNEKLVRDEVKLLAALRTKTDRHPEVQAARAEVEGDKKVLESVFQEGAVLNQYLERSRRIVRGEADRQALAKKVEMRMCANLAAAGREKLGSDRRRLAALRAGGDGYRRIARSIEGKERSRARLEDAAAGLALIKTFTGKLLVPLQVLPPEREGRAPAQLGALAVLLAVLAGSICAIFREATDDRLHAPFDLVRRLGIAPLASVPWARRDRARRRKDLPRFLPAGPVDGRFPRPAPPATEALDAAFDRAAHILLAQEVRTVLVAGAEGRSGKSFVAAGLARAAARLGRRVAVVDADAARPALGRILGGESRWGLSDILSGDLPVRRRIERLALARGRSAPERSVRGGAMGWDLDPLDDPESPAGPGAGPPVLVVPPGSARPDFARLLESHAFRALIEELAASRDLVLVDAPPVRRGGEALSIAPRMDGIVLVARSGRTKAGELLWARKSLGDVGAVILGVILNGADDRGEGAWRRIEPVRRFREAAPARAAAMEA